jgi:hypothetical protein
MDETGRRELLAFDWGQHCMQPIPVKQRIPPSRRVSEIDYAQGFGTYYVQNVYEGAAMAGAPAGCVRKLRVIGLEYRPVHIGWNWQYGWHSTQGKIGTPIAVGKRRVRREARSRRGGRGGRRQLQLQDPGAHAALFPAYRSRRLLYPDDAKLVHAAAGEINGCVGCHEHPHQAGIDNAQAIACAARRRS